VDTYGFDDGSTGDGIGDGLSDSMTGLSGTTSLDDPVMLDFSAGSQIDLGGDESAFGVGEFANGEQFDSLDLSGSTESAPRSALSWDSESESGSGSAPNSNTAIKPLSADGTASFLHVFQKFGTGVAALMHQQQRAPQLASGQPGNPYVNTGAPIATSHLVVALILIGGVIVAILAGGKATA